MEIIADGVLEMFGYNFVNAFRRIDEYLYFEYGYEIPPEYASLIITITIYASTVCVAVLMGVLLWRWARTFINWGVNKLWLQ